MKKRRSRIFAGDSKAREDALVDLPAAWERLAETGQLSNWPSPGTPRIRIARSDPPPEPTAKHPGGTGLSLGNELGFPAFKREVTLNHNPEANSQLVAVRRHVRRLQLFGKVVLDPSVITT